MREKLILTSLRIFRRNHFFECRRSFASLQVAKDEVTKVRKTKNKEEEKWKTYVIDQLQNDLKLKNKKTATLQTIRWSQAQLIRYGIADDWASILSFLHQHARGTNTAGFMNKRTDELIASGLTLVRTNLQRLLKEGNLNSATLTSLCFSYGNLFERFRFMGVNTRAIAILLFSDLRRWSTQRADDDSTDEIDILLSTMEDKLNKMMSSYVSSSCSTYLSPADLSIIRGYCPSWGRNVDRNQDGGYEHDLAVVDPIRGYVSEQEYHGNPYQIDNVSADTYENLFDHHIQREFSTWLPVDNISRRPRQEGELSAEQLIESWKWRDRIVKTIGELKKDRLQYPLKTFLNVVTDEALADVVLKATIAVCSQGQNLVPVTTFNYFLAHPVLRLIHLKFLEKAGIEERKIWEPVFLEYSTLFIDPEVSRTHSHRTWWDKCCTRYGLAPDFQTPFSDFHAEARSQVSLFLTEVVMKACLFPGVDTNKRKKQLVAFGVRSVALEEESRATSATKANLTRMIELNSQMMDQLEEKQFDYILFPTHELPMVVPPRPWYDGAIGGPEYTRTNEIIRSLVEFKRVDINEEMMSRLKSRAQGRPVFDALNQLGATPWNINKGMLEVLEKVFKFCDDPSKKELLETLGVPMKAETIDIPDIQKFVNNHETPEDIPKSDWRQFYKARNEAKKSRNECNSLWYWMMYRVVLAKHFEKDILFFPHNMDFRGRVYPISPYLNHMGDDVNRCILKFAKGKPLGPTGLRWLKLHCINLTGKLKRNSIDERLEHAEKHLDDIIDSADRPLDGKGWWLESEEPWQTLAACMELRDALAHPDPEQFVSHLAVHQDGSCNGLQHYAALGRDKQGGEEVNLLPSVAPNDVYSSVAVRVEQKRLEDEKAGEYMELAQKLRTFLPQAVPRKVIKQTVMTTVYGVTMYGAVLQIKRQLKALGIDNDDTAKFASYLAERTFASLNDSFTCSMQLKDWFRKCAKGTVELMQTVEWVTPLGLPVVQPYLRAKDSKGKLFLAPISTKQIDAFPPNFVHSLDSTHMMLTSLDCSRRGITFAAVHDCFWTHASSVDEMNEICREQFVRLHSEPIVKQCSDWMKERYLQRNVISKMSDEDRLRFEKLFSPQVQAGQLDITDVKESKYFFS